MKREEIMGGESIGSTSNPHPFTISRRNVSISSPLLPKSPPSFPSSSNYIPHLLATSAHKLIHGDKNDVKGETTSGSFVDSVFGSVPTRIEVQNAIAAFQNFIQGLSSSRSALDRLQPVLNHFDPRILQSPGFQRVYDAFHLLQTVPSVQRMLVSISSDRAVWDAVLKNNEVQELQRSLKQDEVCRPQGPNEEPDLVSMILRWILENMKLKVVELIEILKSLISNSLESSRKENAYMGSKHRFEEIISSTVLLSTIVLMVVLVTRVYGA